MADYSKDYSVSYGPDDAACTMRFRCFDVPNAVTLYDPKLVGSGCEELLLQVRALCLKMHRLWSFSLPGSDVARLNARASEVAVDPLTAQLVQAMAEFHEQEPSFDFTVGPVSFLWKQARRVPSRQRIEEALAHVGARRVQVRGATVLKDDPLVQVDVGGAAKGFAADRVVELLRGAGACRADVDLGGNLYMMGDHPRGRPWRVAVKVPEGVCAERTILEVADESVVTSGSYERFVEIEGKRYQHIIDARTGWPAESDVVSATVVAKSSLQADMLATTACLAGLAGLEALRSRHPDCRVVAIASDGRTFA